MGPLEHRRENLLFLSTVNLRPFCGSYRKISLTRIRTLPTKEQTGFIKGRFIGGNLRILNEIIDKVNENNEPGLIFFSDFQKAFENLISTFNNCSTISGLKQNNNKCSVMTLGSLIQYNK